MEKWYLIKVNGEPGPDPCDSDQLTILNRTLKVTKEFLTYQPTKN